MGNDSDEEINKQDDPTNKGETMTRALMDADNAAYTCVKCMRRYLDDNTRCNACGQDFCHHCSTWWDDDGGSDYCYSCSG